MTMTANGWSCTSCGAWVQPGVSHQCQWRNQPVAVGPYQYPSIWQAPKCEHCYCRPDAESFHGVGPHRQCCKCFTTMAEQFINSTTETGS